jgi:hypothetical protein
MKKMLRIWLKYHNAAFVDLDMAEGSTISSIMSSFKMDGYIVREPTPGTGAPFAVAWDGWSFIAILTLPDNNVQARPAGILFDFSGKPN